MIFVLQVIGWVLLIYGFLSLAQDIINEITYKRLNHNMKIVVFAKNLESDIENFSRDLAGLKRRNSYKDIVVIDLNECDNISKIIKRFETEELNLKILNKYDGQKYVNKYLNNIG